MAGTDYSEEEVICQTFMVKRSQNKKRFTPINYKERWFILTKSSLVYYDTDGEVNEAGGVELPTEVFPGSYSLVFQHEAKHCHVAKSLCRVSAFIATVFLLRIDLNASIKVGSDPPYNLFRFEQLIINYTLLVPPNTEKNFEPRIFGFSDDVDAWLGLPHDFLRFGLSYCIHFSLPVMMWCKKPFLFCC
ncbi:Tyrosine-protein kinase Btk29A [Eumeta japonica]|uniref:Tyrosine-protein kinase Btk29A n=1 Tax=Eumeta variegata TaxID=151549 RepID=A0A4C1SPE6_EUMVA|nr:Tyrosine-protein kinase Btk29A [Eumeta japonica]